MGHPGLSVTFERMPDSNRHHRTPALSHPPLCDFNCLPRPALGLTHLLAPRSHLPTVLQTDEGLLPIFCVVLHQLLTPCLRCSVFPPRSVHPGRPPGTVAIPAVEASLTYLLQVLLQLPQWPLMETSFLSIGSGTFQRDLGGRLIRRKVLRLL